MAGIIVDGIKYIESFSNGETPETLIDKIYYVLMDIYWNIRDDSVLSMDINNTIKSIAHDKMNIDVNQSNNILHKYGDSIHKIFTRITENSFHFDEIDFGEIPKYGDYIEFSLWYKNFTVIKSEFELIL